MPTNDKISVGKINVNTNQYKTKKQSTTNNNNFNTTMSNNQGFHNTNNLKMQSTKYDMKKNDEIKLMFGNPYESKIKNHKKSKQTNHNLSIFFNNNTKHKKQSSISAVTPNHYLLNSPYSQQINNFLKTPNEKKQSKQNISITKLK